MTLKASVLDYTVPSDEREKQLLSIIENLELICAQQEQKIIQLSKEIDELRRKIFGKQKETLTNKADVEEISSDEDNSVGDKQSCSTELIEEVKEIQVKSYKRRKNIKEQISALPVKIQEYTLSEEERICDNCHEVMVDMGMDKVREEIEIHRAVLDRLAHMKHNYVCKHCQKQGIVNIKKAHVPKGFISQVGSSSVVTETILQKYQMKVPAYRQEKLWERYGLSISRDAIIRWHIEATNRVLQPLFDLLQEEIVKQEILHADETYYKVIKSNKTNTYYWLFSSGIHEKNQIVLYKHDESRGHAVPKEFLKGFSGYLHCDGWKPYQMLENVIIMNCLAHVRRKFFETIPKKRALSEDEFEATIGVRYCDQLFQIERTLSDCTVEQRCLERKAKLQPIFDEFLEWLNSQKPTKKSKFEKAVNYALNHQEGLKCIFKDGRLELSNNRAERHIKELVMGRKNWLFSNSLAGANASGVILSILKTAEFNGLDIRKYFVLLFEEIPNLPDESEEAIKLAMKDYLPWSKKVQESCKIEFS